MSAVLCVLLLCSGRCAVQYNRSECLVPLLSSSQHVLIYVLFRCRMRIRALTAREVFLLAVTKSLSEDGTNKPVESFSAAFVTGVAYKRERHVSRSAHAYSATKTKRACKRGRRVSGSCERIVVLVMFGTARDCSLLQYGGVRKQPATSCLL